MMHLKSIFGIRYYKASRDGELYKLEGNNGEFLYQTKDIAELKQEIIHLNINFTDLFVDVSELGELERKVTDNGNSK